MTQVQKLRETLLRHLSWQVLIIHLLPESDKFIEPFFLIHNGCLVLDNQEIMRSTRGQNCPLG